MTEKVLIDIQSLRTIKSIPYKVFFNKLFLIPQKISHQIYYRDFLYCLKNYLTDEFSNVFYFFNYFYNNSNKGFIKFLLKTNSHYNSEESLILVYEESKKLKFVLDNFSLDSIFLFVDFIKKQKIDNKELILIEENEKIFLSEDKKVGLKKLYLNDYLAIELFSNYLNCKEKDSSFTKFLSNSLNISIPNSYLELDKIVYQIQLLNPHIFKLLVLLDKHSMSLFTSPKKFDSPNYKTNFLDNEQKIKEVDLEKQRQHLIFTYSTSIKEILNKIRGE